MERGCLQCLEYIRYAPFKISIIPTVPRHSAFPSITLSQWVLCCHILTWSTYRTKHFATCEVGGEEVSVLSLGLKQWEQLGEDITEPGDDGGVGIGDCGSVEARLGNKFEYVRLGWNGSWIAEKCIPILIIPAVWCGPETVQLRTVISAFTRVPSGLCVSVWQMCASVSLWLPPFSCAIPQMEHPTPPTDRFSVSYSGWHS